ncbi:MAG: hypothetical protein BJ554DRAFT_5410 [Olpidium bornovanus]|uniref:Uncharacterized protein n=1 Tax=Olpidium bornovanus TaxID=278681 RepID=A0A8H7ZZN1_9FUNG|nr:MAG: hypothetical protein BJ554DRAFT_5410 [Olpidium bornovanus]
MSSGSSWSLDLSIHATKRSTVTRVSSNRRKALRSLSFARTLVIPIPVRQNLRVPSDRTAARRPRPPSEAAS